MYACMYVRANNHATRRVFVGMVRYMSELWRNAKPSSSRTLSLRSHVYQSSCQALIARAVVDYTADVMRNVGVVASCSLEVTQTLWWYAKLCVPPRSVLFSQNSLWLYLLQDKGLFGRC